MNDIAKKAYEVVCLDIIEIFQKLGQVSWGCHLLKKKKQV